MRVLYASSGSHPEADAAIETLDPRRFSVVRWDLDPEQDDDYFDALDEMWGEEGTFVNVEHDVIVTAEALDALGSCDEPWCVTYIESEYEGGSTALGCAKFSGQLLDMVPDLFRHRIPSRGPIPAAENPYYRPRQSEDGWVFPSKHWARLAIDIAVILEELGVERHVHPIRLRSCHSPMPVEIRHFTNSDSGTGS